MQSVKNFFFHFCLCKKGIFPFLIVVLQQVLGISPSSPLSGYLSRGDVVLSVDGENIHSPRDLIEKMVQVDTQLLEGTGSNGKGYCVPNVLLEDSKTISVLDDKFSCPDGHAAFTGLTYLNSSSSFEISNKHHGGYKKEDKHCLSPEVVVKLTKCGEGWRGTGSLRNGCSCSKVNIISFIYIIL